MACGGGSSSSAPPIKVQSKVDSKKAERDAKGTIEEIYETVNRGAKPDNLFSLLNDPLTVFGPRKGDAMCVFALEDHQGSVEVVVFPETYARFRTACENGALVLVRGKFERDEESARLQATEVLPLSLLREKLSRGVRIRLKAETPRETIGQLWDVVAQYRGDRPLAIEVVVNGGTARTVVRMDVNPSIRVRPSEQFIAAVERLCGQGTVEVH